MEKKSIILAGNKSYELINEIEKNLEFLGFNVITISISNNFVYKNHFQRLINFLLKKNNNTEFEKKLRLDSHLKDFYVKINEIGGVVDYALFIRSDEFSISFIKKIKKISNNIVTYHWDGLLLFSDVIKRIKYFDHFFLFDPYDLSINNNLLPATNFYFDYNYDQFFENESVNNKDVYFFGTYIIFRMEIISKLSKKIKELGFNPDINVFVFDRDNIEKYKDSEIKFLKNKISFGENMKNAQKASVLVDFVNGKHKGLSFRTFDAIGYEKKLITTNNEIKKYDFYHPNNIFILEENNLDKLDDFLQKPYVKLRDEIREKYSFSNWIKYVLKIEPYQKIDLPL